MKSTSPLVSVIIPAHNSESTISDTIHSILTQTFTDFEVIVVDDGSTDTTAEGIAKFSDQRIFYIYQENKERSIARNKGISLAKGEYIALIDDDDLWYPSKIEKQIALIQSQPDLGLVYSDLHYFDSETGKVVYLFSEKVKLYRGWVWDKLLMNNFIQSPTPLIRRKVFESISGFDPKLPPVEDWDLWLRIAAKFPVDYIEEPLAGYRVHPYSTGWANTAERMYLPSLEVIYKARMQEPNLFKKLGRRGHYKIAEIHYNFGVSQLLKGRIKEGLKALWLCILSYPFYYPAYIQIARYIIGLNR